METRETETEMLCLDRPWPQLAAYFNSIHPDSIIDTMRHAHIPYPVLLYHALQKWRAQQPDEKGDLARLPTTREERDRFKDVLRSMSIRPTEEENFQEALQKARLAWTPFTLPARLRDLFQDPKCCDLTAKVTNDA